MRIEPGIWLNRIFAIMSTNKIFNNIHMVDSSMPAPGGASQTAAPRLQVVLAGRRRMRAAWNGHERILDLRAGDVVFAYPGAWLIADGASRFAVASVVYGNRFLRCSHRPWGMHRAPLPPPPHWHHTAHPASPVVNALLVAMLALKHEPRNGADALAIARALAITTVLETIRDLRRPEPRGERARLTWEALCAWMEEQLHRDVGRGEAARAVGVTPNHVTRLFARFGSRGFHAHFADLRLTRARDLLIGSRHPVAAIATNCGMSTHRLIRSFKRRFGATPGSFRNQPG